eukprot:6480199-Amphidinium_carterae.3
MFFPTSCCQWEETKTQSCNLVGPRTLFTSNETESAAGQVRSERSQRAKESELRQDTRLEWQSGAGLDGKFEELFTSVTRKKLRKVLALVLLQGQKRRQQRSPAIIEHLPVVSAVHLGTYEGKQNPVSSTVSKLHRNMNTVCK